MAQEETGRRSREGRQHALEAFMDSSPYWMPKRLEELAPSHHRGTREAPSAILFLMSHHHSELAYVQGKEKRVCAKKLREMKLESRR